MSEVPVNLTKDKGLRMMRFCAYRGISLTRKRTPLEPYCRPMPRVLRGS